MSWQTLELIGQLGDSVATANARKKQEEEDRKKQASQAAYVKQVAPMLGLPTEQPRIGDGATDEEKKSWVDALMRSSAASSEALGYENAQRTEQEKENARAALLNAGEMKASQAQGLPAPTPTEPAKVQVDPRGREAQARATWQDSMTQDLKFRSKFEPKLKEDQVKHQTYKDLQKPEADDLLALMEKEWASGSRGPGGSGNPYADEKEARQWLESAYNKLWAVSGLPKGQLQDSQYQTYAEAMDRYRKIMGIPPEKFPTPTLEELNAMSIEDRRNIIQMIGSLFNKGNGQ